MKRKDTDWAVRDKNARTLDANGKVIPRVHEPAPGVTYALVYNDDTPMPEKHARVFLKDPSFVVTDQDGVEIPALTATALLRVAPDRLPANIVLADVNELTDAALLTRCAQLTGGQRFTSNTAREVLIRFLVDAQAATGRGVSAASPDDDDDAAEIEAEDMDDQDAARMLEGA